MGEIARLLQMAAARRTFGSEVYKPLDDFLLGAWDTFRQFFTDAATVEEAEDHFNIDEYSDATLTSKPTIYISAKEIHYTHELLLANKETVAPDENDPLHEILGDLGELPPEEQALGEEGTQERNNAEAAMSLPLSNKHEVIEKDDSSTKALFVRTKRLVIDVIRFQQGKNLMAILKTPASEEEEAEHKKFRAEKIATEMAEAAKAAEAEAGATQPPTSPRKSTALPLADTPEMTLEETKVAILEACEKLEAAGLCTAANNYQDILNSIAQDIRNQRIYRRQRKTEIAKLTSTLAELNKKQSFYKAQVDFFDQYVDSCMQQLTKSKRPPK